MEAPTITVLNGHTNMDNAYVVDDYPYGYTLRCKIRYWLEWKKGRGFRFMSQTTNPRKSVEVWNKPKASIYMRYGGGMFRDESDGHIHWNGIHGSEDLNTMVSFRDRYAYTMPEEGQIELDELIEAKGLYDKIKAEKELKERE